MGMFDKRRFKKLLLFAMNFDERNPRTFQDMDPNKTTTRDLFSRFDLGLEVMEVTGHAIALHTSERSVVGCCLSQAAKWWLSFSRLVSWYPVVTWTGRVWRPSGGSSCTQSLCPGTAPVRTSTQCTDWESCHRDSQGQNATSNIMLWTVYRVM